VTPTGVTAPVAGDRIANIMMSVYILTSASQGLEKRMMRGINLCYLTYIKRLAETADRLAPVWHLIT
jgi:hypothetical protein